MAAKKKMKAKPVKKSAAKKTTKPAIKAAAAPERVKKPLAAKVVTGGAMLTPLDDRIVVEVAIAESKTAGGIIIPGSVDLKPNHGTVLAKGRGRRTKKGTLRPLDVNVGDHILFAQYSGTPITIEGKEVLILREEDVLGVLGVSQ